MGTQGRVQAFANHMHDTRCMEGIRVLRARVAVFPNGRMALGVSPVPRPLTLAAAEYLDRSRMPFHRRAAGLSGSLGMASQVTRFSPHGGQTDASRLAPGHTFQAQTCSAAMTALKARANVALSLAAKPSRNCLPTPSWSANPCVNPPSRFSALPCASPF